MQGRNVGAAPMIVPDFDGNGHDELVVFRSGAERLSVLAGEATRGHGPGDRIRLSGRPVITTPAGYDVRTAIAIGDHAGNGRAGLAVLLGHGSGAHTLMAF